MLSFSMRIKIIGIVFALSSVAACSSLDGAALSTITPSPTPTTSAVTTITLSATRKSLVVPSCQAVTATVSSDQGTTPVSNDFDFTFSASNHGTIYGDAACSQPLTSGQATIPK